MTSTQLGNRARFPVCFWWEVMQLMLLLTFGSGLETKHPAGERLVNKHSRGFLGLLPLWTNCLVGGEEKKRRLMSLLSKQKKRNSGNKLIFISSWEPGKTSQGGTQVAAGSSMPGIGNFFFFYVKSQKGNILDFAGHTISVTTSQLRHCSANTAIGSTLMNKRVFQ